METFILQHLLRILLGKLRWVSSAPRGGESFDNLLPAPPLTVATVPPRASPPQPRTRTLAPIQQSPLNGPVGPVVTAFSSIEPLHNTYSNLAALESESKTAAVAARTPSPNNSSALMMTRDPSPRRAAYRASFTGGSTNAKPNVSKGASTGTLKNKNPFIWHDTLNDFVESKCQFVESYAPISNVASNALSYLPVHVGVLVLLFMN